jgi:hypothetical protein
MRHYDQGHGWLGAAEHIRLAVYVNFEASYREFRIQSLITRRWLVGENSLRVSRTGPLPRSHQDGRPQERVKGVYCRAEGWRSGWVPGSPARASWVSRAGLKVSDVTGRCAGGPGPIGPQNRSQRVAWTATCRTARRTPWASSTRTFAHRHTSTPLRSQRRRTLDRMHP